MNFAKYYDGEGKPREDLLVIHKQKLDLERGRRWDELNQMRIMKIYEQLLGNEEEVREAEKKFLRMRMLRIYYQPHLFQPVWI